MSSKTVYLKRALPFKHENITGEVMQEQLSFTSRSIGSYYASKSSARIGSGLKPHEEELLVSTHLGISMVDKTKLREEIKKFYSDIFTKIPHGDKGLELEVGLEHDNLPLGAPIMVKKEVDVPIKRIGEGGTEVTELIKQVVEVASDVVNMPINVENYIRFRHAIGYPNTAATVEEMKGNQLIEYYIEDPTKVLAASMKDAEIRDKALIEYIRVKEDADMVNMVVSVLRGKIPKENGKPAIININSLRPDEKVIVMRKLATMRPELFYTTVTDVNLKARYMVDEFIATGLLVKVGDTIVDRGDNDEPLGQTIGEVMVKLSSPRESQRKTRLKSEYDRLKDATSKKVIA